VTGRGPARTAEQAAAAGGQAIRDNSLHNSAQQTRSLRGFQFNASSRGS
jgi:hypothetical protein